MHPFSSVLRRALLLLLIASLAACTTSRIPKPASRLGPGVYQGTGFLVRPDGLVLTAYHVVEDGHTIKVRCQGYGLVPAKLGEHSRTMDLAVLHTDLSGTPYLPPAAPRSVRPGDPVFSMGFPSASYLGTEPKYSSGAISSLSGRGRETTLMLISVPTQPGASGSPLLTMNGAVAGIVTAGTSEEEFHARRRRAAPESELGREDGVRDAALRSANPAGQSRGGTDTAGDRGTRLARGLPRAGRPLSRIILGRPGRADHTLPALTPVSACSGRAGRTGARRSTPRTG